MNATWARRIYWLKNWREVKTGKCSVTWIPYSLFKRWYLIGKGMLDWVMESKVECLASHSPWASLWRQFNNATQGHAMSTCKGEYPAEWRWCCGEEAERERIWVSTSRFPLVWIWIIGIQNFPSAPSGT